MNDDFGRSVSTHRGSFSASLLYWYLGGIFVAAGVLSTAKQASGNGATQGQAAWVGLVGLVVGLGVLLFAYARWKQTLEIFERGFVWQRLIGTRAVARNLIRKVDHVTHISRGTTSVEVVVELTDGNSLSIVGIERADQAANLLSAPQPQPEAAGSGGWQPPSSGVAPTGWTPPQGGAR